MDKTAIEPRIGVAWKPFGSAKTAVRAGYGIFHDRRGTRADRVCGRTRRSSRSPRSRPSSPISVPAPPARAQVPSLQPAKPCRRASRSSRSQLILQPSAGTCSRRISNFKLGRVQQYNVNIEREIPGDVVVTVGYAGSRSSHILVDGMNLNVGSPAACGVVAGYTLGCGSGGAAFSAPYSQFGTIANTNDIGQCALRFVADQGGDEECEAWSVRSRSGTPTLARSIPDLPTASAPARVQPIIPLPGTSRDDWALSQISQNHNFTGSVIYDLPFGRGREFGGNGTGEWTRRSADGNST